MYTHVYVCMLHTQTKYRKEIHLWPLCGMPPTPPVQFMSGHSAILLLVQAALEPLRCPAFPPHCALAQVASAAWRHLSQLVHPPYVPVPCESLLMPVSSPELPRDSLVVMLS